MILVYSKVATHRLVYVLDVLFLYVLGVPYKLTKSIEEFKAFDGPKINYSNEFVESVISVVPVDLLFEKNIKFQNIQVSWIKEIPYFFETQKGKYDVFASSFWMLTRYEEYLPFKPDKHNRFSAKESLAGQNDFLHKPVVNLWAKNLQTQIENLFPEYKFPVKKTSYLNTLDIDIAYAYKGKPFWKLYGGVFKNIFQKDKEDLKARVAYFKTKKDVFDTYDFIESCSDKVKTKFFFLLGDRGEHDDNIHHKKKALRMLIQKLAKKHSVGIHPSYRSNTQKKQLSKEVKRLRDISNQTITSSRQHYLMLKFPDTYQDLIQNKIYADYTMGYADSCGFRAGVCNAYPFYNLELEQKMPLVIVPFQIMDGTLNQYLKLTPEEALLEIKKMIREVKNVKGIFVSLWHNSSLSEMREWKGWRIVYKELLTLMR